MTYKEYREQRQSEFNKLPVFFAFSNDQLERELNERGYTLDEAGEVLYRFGNGGFYLKKDADIIRAFLEKDSDKELREMMKADKEFAAEVIEYEMLNHEYPINWQGDWDVASCFGSVEYGTDKYGEDYLKELGFGEDMVAIWKSCARKVRNSYDW